MGDFNPTPEQQATIDAAKSGDTFVVDACAGSGKTTSAKAMCDAMPSNRILYLVFNRAARDEAIKKFPNHVTVKTTSALAWAEYKDDYGHRMFNGPRVRARDTAKLAGITHPYDLGEHLQLQPVSLAAIATETIDRFCFSADEKISEKHVPGKSIPIGLEPVQVDALRSEIATIARKIWRQSLNPSSKHRFTMNAAFKLYVMAGAALDYDTIILDEAQDSNAATEKLIKDQDTQNIVIGDPAQQLYAWRGAVDIMGNFDGPRLPLSKSWRFGDAVAEEAEKWLEHTGTGVHVTGNEAMRSIVTTGGMDAPDAVLCRSNGGVMKEAIGFMDQGERVAIQGGTSALKQMAYAANNLRDGKPTDHPELVAFSSWEELVAYTEEPGGGDLKVFVQLVNQYGVPGVLDACNRMVDKKHADVVVSTAHKAKGLEWDSVRIGEDFKEPSDVPDPVTGVPGPGPIGRSEAMLHYVAVTRAQHHLDRTGLAWVDRHPAVGRP